MKVVMTGVFKLKESENHRIIRWLETNVTRKVEVGGVETLVNLTLEEVETEYRKLFHKYMQNGAVFSVKKLKGGTAFIDFREVQFATLEAKEEDEDGEA